MKSFNILLLFIGLNLVSHAEAQPSPPPRETIVEAAKADRSLITFLAALEAADLDEMLSGEESFTVLAPNDLAFSYLAPMTRLELLKPENKETLRSVLKFHILPGRMSLAEALELQKLETILGESVTFQYRKAMGLTNPGRSQMRGENALLNYNQASVMVNNADVVESDREVSNGIIHVIDSVLLPTKIKNDITFVADPSDGEATALISESFQLSKMLGSGRMEPLADKPELVSSFGSKVYVQRGLSVVSYDAMGKEMQSFPIPLQVRGSVNFTVLPDERFAFFDNVKDVISFVDKDGVCVETVSIVDKPSDQMQQMYGIVVDGKLIVSENGNNQVLAVDPSTYEVTVFRNLKKLKGWIGAIAFSEGRYYICQAQNIFSFTEDSNELTKVATTPVGAITGIVAREGRLLVSVNGESRISRNMDAGWAKKSYQGALYEVDPASGVVRLLRDGLNYPDGVMLLNSSAEVQSSASTRKTIVETVASEDSFGTLVAALQAADLVDTLNGEDAFTLLAPTDGAFEKLTKNALQELLKPENIEELRSALKYHILPGRMSLGEAMALKKTETVQGEAVTLRFRNGKALVNNAAVIDSNLEGSNGMIHVIDSVLFPSKVKSDITFVANPPAGGPTVLLEETSQLLKVMDSGEMEPFLDQTSLVRSQGAKVYVRRGLSVVSYDASGKELQSFPMPSQFRKSTNFAVLPDQRFALFDNRNDVISFVDKNGVCFKTVSFFDKPGRSTQRMDSIVVDGKLIVSENGERQVMAVDLSTYELTVFRDLQELTGWIGSIAFSEGRYYICQYQSIFSFTEDSSELTKVATVPVGSITGIVVKQGRLIVSVNGMTRVKLTMEPDSARPTHQGALYEVDPASGEATLLRDGLNCTRGVMLLDSKGND